MNGIKFLGMNDIDFNSETRSERYAITEQNISH